MPATRGDGPVLLAAGGTGGHLFPAEALARALGARGVAVHLATDARGLAFAERFPGAVPHRLPSGTVTGGGLAGKARGALGLALGLAAALALVRRLGPRVVVGFGGYPSVPPVLAAQLLGVPTVVHEQNAVVGRANRLLARRARALATGFPLRAVPAGPVPSPLGNPVRAAVLAARAPFAAPEPGGPLRLVAFGGSQGAAVMAAVVPAALAALPPGERARLRVTLQARPEDEAAARAALGAAGVEAEVAPFFADLPARLSAAHLVVARAGASTLAELAALGRPSVLVPLPGSLDGDQAANAAALAAAGAALVLPQAEFLPARLAAELAARLADPAALARAAAAALAQARPDAAERLADLVLDAASP